MVNYLNLVKCGKIAVFAVRLDTFKKFERKIFYYGTNDTATIIRIEKHTYSI